MQERDDIAQAVNRTDVSPFWLVRMVGWLDCYLRHRQGVIEYSDLPGCIFRLQFIDSPDNALFHDGTRVHVGDRISTAYLERTCAPRRRTRSDRGVRPAFGSLHRHLPIGIGPVSCRAQGSGRCRAISAGNLVLGSKARGVQIARIAVLYGFEPICSTISLSLSQRLHRLGENILISMLVLARNPRTLRSDTLWRDRTLTYLAPNARATIQAHKTAKPKPGARIG